MIQHGPTTRTLRFSCVGMVGLAPFMIEAAATATEIRWQPISATGTGLSYEIVDHEASEGVPSEIRLDAGGDDVVITVEIHINYWAPAHVGTYNTSMDPASITSDWGDPIVPVGWPDDPWDGAYLDSSHPNFIFRSIHNPCLPMPSLITGPTAYEWGASVFGGCSAVDEGDNNYGGTLLLSVPAGAAGTYAVEFNPSSTKTLVNDPFGVPLELTRVPLMIVLPRDCNNNGISDEQEIALGIAEDCNENDNPDDCDIDFDLSEDCNGNGRPDECDILTQDCNSNGIPDSCDLAAGTSPDCNGNGLPDECDVAAGTSQDCNTTGVPDECEDDCNENGLADECDLAGGASLDHNVNGLPDECEILKNRYVTFASASAGPPVAYQVEMTESALFPNSIGVMGWIGPPDQLRVSRVIETPHFSDEWPTYVYVGDCEIVPASVYGVRGTTDGVAFGDPVVLATVGTPDPPQLWGDVIGGYSEESGWSPPNGVVNFDDIFAIIRVYEHAPNAPHWTWVDVDAAVPNTVVNMTDLQMVGLGFTGRSYPYPDPAACP